MEIKTKMKSIEEQTLGEIIQLNIEYQFCTSTTPNDYVDKLKIILEKYKAQVIQQIIEQKNQLCNVDEDANIRGFIYLHQLPLYTRLTINNSNYIVDVNKKLSITTVQIFKPTYYIDEIRMDRELGTRITFTVLDKEEHKKIWSTIHNL